MVGFVVVVVDVVVVVLLVDAIVVGVVCGEMVTVMHLWFMHI